MYLLSEDLSIQDQSKSWGTAFSQTEVLAAATVPFLTLPITDPESWQVGTIWRLYQPGSHCLSHPSDSPRPCPTQLSGPPKLFPVAFPYEWLVLAHASDFPKSSQTSSIWLQ